MIAACKCKNCGHIEMSSGDDVTLEIDFLEQRILYICRQCKYNNTMKLSEIGGNDGSKPLPRIGVTRG